MRLYEGKTVGVGDGLALALVDETEASPFRPRAALMLSKEVARP
jgi:hypothetical protein